MLHVSRDCFLTFFVSLWRFENSVEKSKGEVVVEFLLTALDQEESIALSLSGSSVPSLVPFAPVLRRNHIYWDKLCMVNAR